RKEGQHDVWIDHQLVPGSNWWENILENIESCEAFIYVMTPKSVTSIYCLAELSYAMALNKPILPLMLKSSDYPPLLNRIQYRTVGDNLQATIFSVERDLAKIR